MKKTALKLIYFSIFFCLEAVSSPTTVAPLSATDNLVVFTPEIKLDSSSLCRGIRVSRDLLATAPECVVKIRELSDYKPIAVHTAQGESLGEVSESKLDDPQKEMLLPLTLDEESASGEKYLGLYNAASAPEQAFAYSIDPQGQLARQPVVLSDSEELAGKSFTISSEAGLPSGSPVLDTHGRLVCIISDDSRCHILKRLPQGKVKRELEDDPDDYDYDADNYIAQELGILAGVLVAAVATSTGLFYLVSFLKAYSKGMPANVFWPGILLLKYCSYCSIETAIPAIIGIILCPFGTIAPLVGCPVSAYLAVSKWVNDYDNPASEQAPIITQQPQVHLP